MRLDGNNQRSLDKLNKKFIREYYEGEEWTYMERLAYRQKILELLSLQRKDWHGAKFILDLGCNRGPQTQTLLHTRLRVHPLSHNHTSTHSYTHTHSARAHTNVSRACVV